MVSRKTSLLLYRGFYIFKLPTGAELPGIDWPNRLFDLFSSYQRPLHRIALPPTCFRSCTARRAARFLIDSNSFSRLAVPLLRRRSCGSPRKQLAHLPGFDRARRGGISIQLYPGAAAVASLATALGICTTFRFSCWIPPLYLLLRCTFCSASAAGRRSCWRWPDKVKVAQAFFVSS